MMSKNKQSSPVSTTRSLRSMIFRGSYLLFVVLPTFLIVGIFFVLDIDILYKRIRASNRDILTRGGANLQQRQQSTHAKLSMNNNSNEMFKASSTRFPTYLLIDDYVKWHKKNRYRAKTLIYRCPRRKCGGVGDRLRGIVQAYLLAVVNQRIFLIDWNEPYPLSDILAPNKLDWRFIPKHDSPTWDIIPPTNEKQPFVPPSIDYSKPNILLSLENHTLILSERRSANLPRILNASNSYFQPLLNHSLPYLHSTTLFRLTIQALFKPSSKLLYTLKTIKKELNIINPYLAVHARIGIGIGEIENYGERFERYANNLKRTAKRLAKIVIMEWKKLKKEKKDNNSHDENKFIHLCCIFFATDTPKLRGIFEKEIKKFNSNIRVVGGSWIPKHFIDIDYDNSARNNSNNHTMMSNKKDSFFESMLDLWLIAGAKMVVHLPSVFTNVAFWLGDAEQTIEVKWGDGNDNVVELMSHRAFDVRGDDGDKDNSKNNTRLQRFQMVGRMPWEDERGRTVKSPPRKMLEDWSE